MSHVIDGSVGSFGGFPAELFRLDGDPYVITRSASGWSEFGTEASDAAGQIRALDTSLFLGPEAESYREGLSQDLVPHLERTGQAYAEVGRALSAFAAGLSELQEQLAPLTVRAPHLWDQLQAARTTLGYAQAADHDHAQVMLAHRMTANPLTPALPDAYQSHTGAATRAVSAAQQAWDQCAAAATGIHTEHATFIESCCQAIEDAKGAAFAHNPHGLGALTAGFKTFVTDHATGLAKLSGALKLVSGVASVLAFIPVIDLVAAPLAIATAAAALAIDASIKLATGQGSWATIALDAALIALPGLGKLARSAAESSTRLTVGLSNATQDAKATAAAEHEVGSLNDSARTGTIEQTAHAGVLNEVNATFLDKERIIAQYLTDKGHTVEAIRRSIEPDVRTPDALVDGVRTEFKTAEGSTSNTILRQLRYAKSQARAVVIDARNAAITRNDAERGLARALSQYIGDLDSVTILGSDYTIEWRVP